MNFELSACVLASVDEDGFVRCQPEPYGSKGALPSYEAFQPFGLCARPKGRTDGTGANALVMRMGPDGRVLLGHDPRWAGTLPDLGDGGAALYATTELSGTTKAPYIAIFGEDGAAAEGLFRISIPSSAGTTTIEVSPSTGDVTITHQGGTTLTIKGSEVLIGGTGALALAKAAPLVAWAASVVTAITGLGGSCPPLADPSCTKAKGL